MNAKQLYQTIRLSAIEYLGGKCIVCKSDKNLEFDHIHPELKEYNVSKIWMNEELFWKELKKCQLLCNTCHKKKTKIDLQDFHQSKQFTHGTQYGWSKKDCKCKKCLDHKIKWNEERNKKRRKSDNIRGPYNRESNHGESLHYHRGCRCRLCKDAHAVSIKQWRDNKQAPLV